MGFDRMQLSRVILRSAAKIHELCDSERADGRQDAGEDKQAEYRPVAGKAEHDRNNKPGNEAEHTVHLINEYQQRDS